MRRARRGLPILIAVALLASTATSAAAAAASSPAERFPVGSPEIAAAQQIARAHWGADACGGAVTITWRQLSARTNAVSYWFNDTDPWSAPAKNTGCSIQLNTAQEFDGPKLCTVLVHEYGHLTGHPHDDSPGRLMSPIYSTPTPACAQEGAARRAVRRAQAHKQAKARKQGRRSLRS